MSKKLDDVFGVNRRYSRSVSLDRDLDSSESLKGYVLTPKNCDLAMRILSGVTTSESTKAWTITGLYGTGKSAFAQFLSALCAPSTDKVNLVARSIGNGTDDFDRNLYATFRHTIGRRGMVRAAAAAQREPVGNTVVRALFQGAGLFWTKAPGAKPKVLSELARQHKNVMRGKKVSSKVVVDLVVGVASASKSGLLLVIDELGKNLEYSAVSFVNEDIYLLQQLAELPVKKGDPPVCLIGILHQSFSDYGHNLASIQRNEWSKVQGRFEDVPFNEATDQVIRLISEVIAPVNSLTKKFFAPYRKLAKSWKSELSSIPDIPAFVLHDFERLLPLHPFSVIVLPVLCERFGQNDRSLFSFLTSEEPSSFPRFLKSTALNSDSPALLKLDSVYDYFIESAGLRMAKQQMFQRWAEIQRSVADASHMGVSSQRLLKIIGVLNIVSTGGGIRASRRNVLFAVRDQASDSAVEKEWSDCLDSLIEKGLITFRAQVDEYRIWEGSDFDADRAVRELLPRMREPLAESLTKFLPPRPSVAHRHSYETGNLRFFDTRFVDSESASEILQGEVVQLGGNGLLCYWVDEFKGYRNLPPLTSDGHPVVVLVASESKLLRSACLEFAALRHIEKSTPELMTDGVARKEVRQRLEIAKQILEKSFDRSFRGGCEMIAVACGKETKISGEAELSHLLSDVCDETYSKGPRLWNELINKNSITSQAAKARRELLEFMVEREGSPTLGIEGYGPARSLFESLLASTGIYACRRGTWSFGNPKKDSGVLEIWTAMEIYFVNSTKSPSSISALLDMMKRPPYGAKSEILPVFIAAILLKHADDMSLYLDGSFLPVLGAEHLELLVKRPERFSVKHFRLSGLRSKLFKELESTVSSSTKAKVKGVRNATILKIVRPMVKFINSLPKYTIQTESIDRSAQNVRKFLLSSRDPDVLLFQQLPTACGLEPITASTSANDSMVKEFRRKLVYTLRILHSCYDRLLDDGRHVVHEAFSVESDLTKLREHLRVRAIYLLGICIEPRLRSFIKAAVDETVDDRRWLESLLMIIADKPVPSWTDEDVAQFEINASDMARRFINFEALRKEFVGGHGKGFSARRVVLTRPSGEESSRVLWVEHGTEDRIESVVSDIISKHGLNRDKYLLQGVLSSLLDQSLFEFDDKGEASIPLEEKEEKSGKAG